MIEKQTKLFQMLFTYDDQESLVSVEKKYRTFIAEDNNIIAVLGDETKRYDPSEFAQDGVILATKMTQSKELDNGIRPEVDRTRTESDIDIIA